MPLVAGLLSPLGVLAQSSPGITTQPQSQTKLLGTNVVFAVVASGQAPLAYQWSVNGIDLTDSAHVIGATNSTLTINSIIAGDAGSYRVVVTNRHGSVTSSAATLTVLVPAQIASGPTSQLILLNSNVSFSAAAVGTAPLTYKWLLNGAPLSDGGRISGSATTNLSIVNVQTNDAGSYQMVVTNNYGSATSVVGTLIVRVPPSITTQPLNGTYFIGNNVSISGEATGDAPLVYQWYFNGLVLSNGGRISGATTSSLSLTDLHTNDAGPYYLVVTNNSGSVTSDTAHLTVLVPATIVQQPQSLSVLVGSNAQFSVTAAGDPPLTYRWAKNHSPLDEGGQFSGVFTANLTVSNVQTSDAGSYSVEVFGVGSDVSADAVLTVLVPPSFSAQPQSANIAVGNYISLSANVTGTAPIDLQWFFNGTALTDDGRISGSTNLSLSISNAQSGDSGSYWLVASNIAGVATSAVATVSVLVPPSITLNPSSQSVGTGTNVTFTTAATGDGPLNYQWYRNGVARVDSERIIGATTASLTILGAELADQGSYSAIVTNLVGSATSGIATLEVFEAPTFTTQPVGHSAPPGFATGFIAAVRGFPSRLQWQLNEVDIPGATNTSYSIAAVGTNDLGLYHLIASNAFGVATSADAKLTFGNLAAWGRNVSLECFPPADLTNAFAVGGVYGASYAARTDGTLVGWGTSAGTIPTNATNVVALSANSGIVVLRADGTIVGWNFGAPTANFPVPSASNIVAVAAGNNFGFALRAEGTLVPWGGFNYSAQTNFPAGLNHVTSIACGTAHVLALRNDGTVVTWGDAKANPTLTNPPPGLTNVVGIAAGFWHSLALKADGTVTAWGSSTSTNLPAGLTNIAAIYAGSYPQGQSVNLAIRSNGTVVVWGDNGFGETNPPTSLSNLISVAGAGAAYHAMTILSNAAPLILRPPVGLTTFVGRNVTLRGDAAGASPLSYQWLKNGGVLQSATDKTLTLSNIQLANAGTYQLVVSNAFGVATSLPAPVNVINNNTLSFLSQPGAQTNYHGSKIVLGVSALGNGPLRYQWYFAPTNTFSDGLPPLGSYAPVPLATNDILTLDPALASQSGKYYVVVSNQVNSITSLPVNVRILFARAWGFQAVTNPPVNVTNAVAIATGNSQNYYGTYYAIGADGKVTAWANYSPSYGETNVSALSNSFVTAISAGVQSALALRSDGTVYAWGNYSYGQTNVPAGLKDVVAIACGDYHDIALKNDGTVIAWGRNFYGEGTNSLVPANAAVAIAAGSSHNLGLRANGTVFGWGYNIYGQITIPPAATNVIAIAAGTGHSLALRADGTVVQWGSSMVSYPVPGNLSNVVAISASGTHSTALRSDGTISSWGYDYINTASNYVPSDLANVIAITSSSDHDFGLLGTRAPTFTIHPFSRNLFKGTNTLFVGKVAGAQPMSYQWQFNGMNISGATKDNLSLTNLQFTNSGAYQLIASNSYGTTSSKPAKLAVTLPLATALDTTNVTWAATGSGFWFGQTNVSHDGVDAAQSGDIGNNQESILQATVFTNTPGRYAFWWKVSSEPVFDTLEVRLNGVVVTNISGQVDWQQVFVPVAAGTNILQWRYSKDGSNAAGQDAAWVDQLTFYPAPAILTQPFPANRTVYAGTTVSYYVLVMGTTPSTYQWWQNGSKISWATNANFGFYSPGRAQNGTYFVTISNLGGTVTSSNITLKVLVPQNISAPTLLSDGTFQFSSIDSDGTALTFSNLANFTAEASSNLVDWSSLPGALSISNGILRLQDSGTTNASQRFYRIVENQ